MYLAMAFAYLGLAIWLNNSWALVFLMAVLVVIDGFVIRREERYLAEKFGEAYRQYCSRVRRWI
jgi:protein-S-isoprenylcysteine O-methyltransferase Ste14